MTKNSVLSAALRYRELDLSIIPLRADGSKKAAVLWKEFESRRASVREIRSWFASGDRGIGIVCGEVSGGLEVIDFDGWPFYETWRARMREEHPGIFAKLVRVRTPRPGCHVLFRSSLVEGNQVLARRSIDDGAKALIETRGEGGYVLAPGSPAHSHPTGVPYQQISKRGFDDLQKLTEAERDIMMSLAREQNRYERRKVAPRLNEQPHHRTGRGSSPIDDFNRRTPWRRILEPHGWQLQEVQPDGQILWTRPGKDGGTSASTGFANAKDGTEFLHVFSSNAEPFEPDRGYTRFGAFMLLEFDGDGSAAFAEICRRGFGRSTRKASTSRRRVAFQPKHGRR